MKKDLQNGFTLIEMTVTLALVGFVALGANNLYNFTRRESDRLNEDIQATITRYGGSKIIMKDLSAAELSFNFINIPDDSNLPFFVLAQNELCSNKNCQRHVTLKIPTGATLSKSIFLIVRKGYPEEMLKFTIDPLSTYEARQYSGINWQYKNEDLTISKSKRPYSPWAKGRLLLLSSEMSYYDCENLTERNGDSCKITCEVPGSCNYVAKRPMRFLGMVNDTESDLDPVSHPNYPKLFNLNYRICRPDTNLTCSALIDISEGIKSSKNFFTKLPYVPGMDNRSYFSPVEVIEYFLKRPSPNSPDHDIQLMRRRLKASSKGLVADHIVPLMDGVQTIEFRRSNISNVVIEYKLTKVNMRKSVK